jgi:nicotinate-nucleotide adenylyltransferase
MEVSATATGGSTEATGGVRMGVFGGTFDPPHVGHQHAIEASRRALGLDELRVVVAGDPWQKSANGHMTSAHHRLAMARLAFEPMGGVVVDDCEVGRPGPSYTVDTLEALASPGVTLVLVLGADAAAGLGSWHRHADLPALAELAVVTRSPEDVPEAMTVVPAAWAWRLHRIDMDPVAVSSTDVRRRLRAGEDLSGVVEPQVVAYVRSHGLYREERDES